MEGHEVRRDDAGSTVQADRRFERGSTAEVRFFKLIRPFHWVWNSNILFQTLGRFPPQISPLCGVNVFQSAFAITIFNNGDKRDADRIFARKTSPTSEILLKLSKILKRATIPFFLISKFWIVIRKFVGYPKKMSPETDPLTHFELGTSSMKCPRCL